MSDENVSCGSVEVTGGRIAYRRAGQAERVIVLLHGWPQSSWAWVRVMRLLVDKFTIVALDLPGFGDSSKPLYGFDKKTIAARLREALQGLEIGRFLLAGHDMGGQVAYAYAAQWPDEVSHLVFVESALPGFGQEKGMDISSGGSWHFGFNMEVDLAVALVSGRERLFIDYLLHRTKVGLFNTVAVSKADLDRYADALARPGTMRCMCEYYRALSQDRDDNRVLGAKPLTMPVLSIGGAQGYGPGIAMRQVASIVSELTIKRCGHYVPEERPVELAEAIRSLLEAK